MNITQILNLYVKKTQKNLAFFLQLSDVSRCLLTSMVLFAQLDQLQAAHLIWSGRGWWAQERGRGGTRSYLSTGRSHGYDCSSPCEERTLWDGPVLHAPLSPAPRWQPQSEFFWGGNGAVLLPVMPWAPCCSAREHTVVPWLVSPWEHGAWCPPVAMPPRWQRIPAKAIFGTLHYLGSATTTSRTTDEQCHSAKAN